MKERKIKIKRGERNEMKEEKMIKTNERKKGEERRKRQMIKDVEKVKEKGEGERDSKQRK